jgi:hypothetical protein
MTVIFETAGEELYVQDDGSLALVTGDVASVMSAEEAIEHFPEYTEAITAALAGLERYPPEDSRLMTTLHAAECFPLLRADPHHWGAGLVHLIDEETDQTLCGKSPGGCPGTKF